MIKNFVGKALNFLILICTDSLAKILPKLKPRGFRAFSLSTYDLSTLSTTLPHNLIYLIIKLVDLT